VMISIDHEGGRVQRCRTDGFTHLPAMKKLGDIWSNGGKKASTEHALKAMEAATAVGFVLASELRACGVDFSFTPVLDLDFGRSGVIGDRSFNRDPQIAAMLAKSLNHGLQLAGMANCGKHFPGHGWAEADSHIAIPVDERSLTTIINDDAKPYEYLGLGLASVMPAHVIYPKVDKHPAGFSKIWLQDILRKQLKFTGVIFSDDLSMEGASVAGSVVKGAQMALKAGCDQVLICNRPDLADQLLKDLAYDEKAYKISRARVQKLMPTSQAMDWDELQASPDYQRAKQLLKDLKLV
jgi:beta-N-acetylhexosaminidase